MNPIKDKDKGRYRKYGYKLGYRYHVGHDYDVGVGTKVYAIAKGKVIYSGRVSGFGSANPTTAGEVIIIEHKINGADFISLYGHIIRYKESGSSIKEGEVLGTVAQYTDKGIKIPHLHFAIHMGKGLPKTNWGYVDLEELKDWINPKHFLEGLNGNNRTRDITI